MSEHAVVLKTFANVLTREKESNIWHLNLICESVLSRIQTLDLIICLYFNLKHGELDHLAITHSRFTQNCYTFSNILSVVGVDQQLHVPGRSCVVYFYQGPSALHAVCWSK